MPYRNGNTVWNATEWTDGMIKFLKDNFRSLTNQQLATALNLGRTVTRNKLRELGLKRMELEYWCDEQIQYLQNNYKKKGDVEIMEFFKKKWPKQKGWKRNAIHQKRKYLGLHRTEKQIHRIASKNSSFGGRSFTIGKNSCSKNMHPKWVAHQIARLNPELHDELIKDNELIETARALIKLKRVIKQKLKDASRFV